MLCNYFKIAFRNLLKYKFISFINLFGLTVGLSCCLLILSYIINELSYDKYNEKADRTYRVTRNFLKQDKTVSLHLGAVAPPFGPAIKNEFPDIEVMTRLLSNGNSPIKYEDKKFNEKGVFWADENLFNVFTGTVVKGNPKTALAEPYTAMLTEDIAKKYFGNEDPMNKVFLFAAQYPFKVTGVFKSFPSNSHIHPKILLSFNSLKDTTLYGEKQLQTNFGNNSFLTYLVFPKNYPVEKVEALFPALIDKYMPRKDDMTPGSKPSDFTNLFLQKLPDIHLKSHLDYEVEENGDITRVYIFSAIALFILLIACINYMNLSTARSVLRSKEIGIRKVVGAQRKEIIAQFLSESVLITTVALILAILITALTLPLLNKLSGQELSMQLLNKWYVVVPLLLSPLIIGIFSGIYPSLFMSSFQPIKVLKGMFKVHNTQISLRKVLVIAQFTISIILIISTVVVLKQLNYIQTKNLGYNKEQIVNIAYPAGLNNYESFRNELMSNASIKNVARSSRIPTGRLLDGNGTKTISGDTTEPANINLRFVRADYDFIPTYNIGMLEGRNFSRDYGTDTTGAYIINHAAAELLGWGKKGEAVGKDIVYGDKRGKIIGVINDFHFETLHEKISAMILLLPPPSRSPYSFISIKINGNNIKGALAHIERTWAHTLPDAPFDYTFLNDKFDNLYKAEQKQATVFTIFSFIAIFIACLGLFGLSAFTITQRIKEIGIRKVLGASIGSIVTLLSKDFMRLVIVASVIAFPIAWYAMHNWLEDFAYRINIPWWAFILAAILAAIIAFVTISFQAIKAAIANPVKSLRTE